MSGSTRAKTGSSGRRLSGGLSAIAARSASIAILSEARVRPLSLELVLSRYTIARGVNHGPGDIHGGGCDVHITVAERKGLRDAQSAAPEDDVHEQHRTTTVGLTLALLYVKAELLAEYL